MDSYFNQINMNLETLDFAKNQKTVTGIAVFLLPLLFSALGFQLDTVAAGEIVAQLTTISGAALALYGLIMKLVRFIKEIIK